MASIFFRVCILALTSCIAHAQISVSHDDMFYLVVDENEVAITITNDSDQLVVVKNTMHDSLGLLDTNDGKKIQFDLENESMEVDIYPRIIPIPPSQTRTLTAIMASSINDLEQKEAAYRIISTPLSSKEIIEQQPMLYRLLGKQDRQNIDEMANTEGGVEVTIGVGSIIIFQKEQSLDEIIIDVNITVDDKLAIKNTADRVVRLRKVRFYDNDSTQWLYHDGVIIRPGHTQLIEAYIGKNISRMEFVDHFGKDYSIKVNKS